ncbi:MAG: hypothetical protein BGO21_02940 [Dyadobacter sp. 50-39]|uniref:CheR family methyltransferase n=1 Tax=Dyadobacter sp. 50-39 TaxID=1895756 RepID=UPI00095E4179|nr:CheR family methyltransferase [Dyadobacter sp. 50-39]OJV12717.1 MAG: hypothetical protein BGO21_02940 [Dyadobacter sp. 50-39]
MKSTPTSPHGEYPGLILGLLRRKSGVDLLNYKQTTLGRRISRRLDELNLSDVGEYYMLLQDSEQEQHLLCQQMLIHVTSFFRDEKGFEDLCRQVIPDLIADKGLEHTVRVWVCGCSTGEEAYSIAICLHEHLEKLGNLSRVKIFASDVSEPVITKARQGLYSKQATEKISPERLETYFTATKEGYRIKPFIRDMCVFAVHNVLSDPPFAKIDLLTCRNLLIYFQPVLQKKVLATFSYAINPGGYLFLGKSETSGPSGSFESVNKSANIFVNRQPTTTFNQDSNRASNKPVVTQLNHLGNFMEKKDFQIAADELLLQKYVPVGVVVNESFDIVDFRGNTGFFIEPSPGIASFNVLKMVRKGLYYDLNELLNKVRTERVPVKRENIALEHEGKLLRITLEVQPLPSTREKYYLVMFQTVQSMLSGPVSGDGGDDARDLRILQLEQELVQSREQLRTLSEEQEAVNEEFQSANEELKSLNEELQTSQEEVISINEELMIRNKELAETNDQLTKATDYAESINNTINDALLVLDATMRIKSANATFYEKFHVLPQQTEGKLLFDLGNGQWDIAQLREQLLQVLPSKKPVSSFVVSNDFPMIGKKVMKLNARQIKGATKGDELILLAIDDITELTMANERIQEKQELLEVNEERQRLAIEATHYGIWDYEIKSDLLFLSKEAQQILSKDSISFPGWRGLLDGVASADLERVQSAFENAIESSSAGFFAEEYRLIDARNQSTRWVSNHGKAIFDEKGKIKRFTGIIGDITEQKVSENKLKEALARLDLALQAGQIGSWELRLSDMTLVTSGRCKANFGLPAQAELTYTILQNMILPEDRPQMQEAVQRALHLNEPYHCEYRIHWPDDSIHWIEASGTVQTDSQANPVAMIGVTTDITERKDVAQKLEYSEQHFKTLANSSPVMVGMSDAEGNFYFFNSVWQKYIGVSEAVLRGNKWTNYMHPDDLVGFADLQQSASARNARFQRDIRLRTMGKYRWVTCIAQPRFGADNKFAGYTMACTDIHDQRAANEELERRIEERTGALRDLNDDLQDRNRELKQFAYVTSHDLQEPLRKIKLFAGMLLAKESGDNTYHVDYLQKIEFSASRMIGLIHDLLNYSSIQDRATAFTPVDLSKIVHNVLADYDLLIQDKRAVISLGTLPTIDAVPSQINQLFYNLIGNSLKFSKSDSVPEISVTSAYLPQNEISDLGLNESQDYVKIVVSDNGIGFSPEYDERVFEIFQRLHDRNEYTGNGIGLALCKRIVVNHGGLILPFSEENCGARFEIILPDKQNLPN